MRKYLFLSILVLSFANAALADTGMENTPPPKTGMETPPAEPRKTSYPSEGILSQVTPQIGLTSSRLSGNNYSTSSLTGINIGATLDFGRDMWVFETGALYRLVGGQENDDFGDSTKLYLGYIAIPVLAKYYFHGEENNSPFISFGALPSILVSKKVTYDGPLYSGSSTDIGGLSAVVLDAMIAVGGKFKATPTSDIMIDVTFTRSLTSVSTMESGVANNVLGINIGMGFNL